MGAEPICWMPLSHQLQIAGQAEGKAGTSGSQLPGRDSRCHLAACRKMFLQQTRFIHGGYHPQRNAGFARNFGRGKGGSRLQKFLHAVGTGLFSPGLMAACLAERIPAALVAAATHLAY